MVVWIALVILFILAIFGAGVYGGWLWSGTS